MTFTRRHGSRLAMLLVLGAATVAHGKFACVSNTAMQADQFPYTPACQPCRGAQPPPYCFWAVPNTQPATVLVGNALAATQFGDEVFIDAPLGIAGNASVDGQHIITTDPLSLGGGAGGPVAGGSAVTGLTVYRGVLEGLGAYSLNGGSPLDIVLEQTRCESAQRCDVVWREGGVFHVVQGAYAGVRVLTSPPGWDPEWFSIGQVTLERFGDAGLPLNCSQAGLFCGQPGQKPCCPGFTCDLSGHCAGTAAPPERTSVILDGEAVFTCRECRLDLLSPGVGVDVLHSTGPLTALVDSTVRPFEDFLQQGQTPDYRWAIRRLCSSRLEVVGARFAREPSSAVLCRPNPIDEVGVGPSCEGDTLIDAPGTCGATFVATPNVLGTFRGAMPFACPGNNFNAYAVGSRWFDTSSGIEKVCTPAGWSSFVLN